MEARPWYPVFERQALFLRAMDLYTKATKAQHAARCYPVAELSSYDRDRAQFSLCDDHGCVAVVELESGAVHLIASSSTPTAYPPHAVKV
jgi:hypothetical protein